MTALQFYAFLAFLVAVYFIIKMVLDPTEEVEEEVDKLRKKQKELFMMVQDCNQRYEELKARVSNLERKDD